MTDFQTNYKEMLCGIDLCIKEKLQFPALTLIYSLIDIFAYRCYENKSVKERFTKWISEYMDKDKALNIEPIDLYSARCAILHTLTPSSVLTKENKASEIGYAWGKGDLKTFEEMNKNIDVNLPIIHINELYESLKTGILRFESSDIKSSKEVEDYSYISHETLTRYNEVIKYKSRI